MNDKPRTTNDVLRDARDILRQRYISDENAPALVKEIDALLNPPSPAGQPLAGAPFIEHLRFNPMDHQGISTHKHRERIHDALRDTATVVSADPPTSTVAVLGPENHPSHVEDPSLAEAVTAPKPVAVDLMGTAFRERLADGKYTRWAVDLDAETLRLVLWFVGEYGCRGGLHNAVEPGIAHPRTLGASRVLVALEHGQKISFNDAVRMMDNK